MKTITRTAPRVFTCDVPGHDCVECREGHVNAGTDPTCGPICRECGGDLIDDCEECGEVAT
jgi:hypothetical protein